MAILSELSWQRYFGLHLWENACIVSQQLRAYLLLERWGCSACMDRGASFPSKLLEPPRLIAWAIVCTVERDPFGPGSPSLGHVDRIDVGTRHVAVAVHM